MSRRIWGIAGIACGGVIVAQLFQPARTNPASAESESFRAVARPPVEVVSVLNRACRDCHSNDTVWPWYSRVAPVSWIIAGDVQKGRRRLNFSQWNRSGGGANESAEEICPQMRSRAMPPRTYLALHPVARLREADVDTVCAGMRDLK